MHGRSTTRDARRRYSTAFEKKWLVVLISCTVFLVMSMLILERIVPALRSFSFFQDPAARTSFLSFSSPRTSGAIRRIVTTKRRAKWARMRRGDSFLRLAVRRGWDRRDIIRSSGKALPCNCLLIIYYFPVCGWELDGSFSERHRNKQINDLIVIMDRDYS